MSRLPLAVRVAAGLAATAVDEVRGLPSTVVSLPVTAVSQVLQNYMRVQQQITSLAIKGDEVLSFLQPTQESPPWATFDQDDAQEEAQNRTPPRTRPVTPPGRRPSAAGRFALYSQVPDDLVEHENDSPTPSSPTPLDAAKQHEAAAEAAAAPKAPLLGYDAMTLAQLRARLRTLSLTELEDLLLHERGGQARAPFLTMLSNRIASVRSQ